MATPPSMVAWHPFFMTGLGFEPLCVDMVYTLAEAQIASERSESRVTDVCCRREWPRGCTITIMVSLAEAERALGG